MTTSPGIIKSDVAARIAEVQKSHIWAHTLNSHCSCGWKAEGLVNVLEQWSEHVAGEIYSAISGNLLEILKPAVDALDSDSMALHSFIHHVRREVRG